jgi:hypothetical protein
MAPPLTSTTGVASGSTVPAAGSFFNGQQRFWANQLRLLLHAAAYWLLDTVRRWLAAAGAARRQLDTLRLDLIKIGGRVYQWATSVRLRLASSHPGQSLWTLLAHRPGRP